MSANKKQKAKLAQIGEFVYSYSRTDDGRDSHAVLYKMLYFNKTL